MTKLDFISFLRDNGIRIYNNCVNIKDCGFLLGCDNNDKVVSLERLKIEFEKKRPPKFVDYQKDLGIKKLMKDLDLI
jgi:hypothetical protein